jgi:hypothetical protein
MEAKPPTTKYCIFTERDHDIWEFQFVKAHNLAVDEWVAWQDYLSKQPPKPDVTIVRTLLDFRPDGPIPLLYALQKNFEWRKRNPNIDPIPVKVAIMLKQGSRFQKAYADLLKEGVNVFGMRRVRVELFYDAYPQAIRWLLQD